MVSKIVNRELQPTVRLSDTLELSQLDRQWKKAYPNPTYIIDQAYAILLGPWVKPEEREAARLFRDFLWEEEQQRSGLTYGFRPSNPRISVQVPKKWVSRVQPPSVDVADALFQLWEENYSSVPTV